MVRAGIRLQALPPHLGAKQEGCGSAGLLAHPTLNVAGRFVDGPRAFLVHQPQLDELADVEADLSFELAVFEDLGSLETRWQSVDEQVLRLGRDLRIGRRLGTGLADPFMDGLSVGEWLAPFFLAGDDE